MKKLIDLIGESCKHFGDLLDTKHSNQIIKIIALELNCKPVVNEVINVIKQDISGTLEQLHILEANNKDLLISLHLDETRNRLIEKDKIIEKQSSFVPFLTFMLLFVTTGIMLILTFIEIPSANRGVMNQMTGSLITCLVMSIGFWFKEKIEKKNEKK